MGGSLLLLAGLVAAEAATVSVAPHVDEKWPLLAAGLSAAAPASLTYLAVVSNSGPYLAPVGLGAGHFYAGDPWRAAIISGGAAGLVWATYSLLPYVAIMAAPSPDEFQNTFNGLSRTITPPLMLGIYVGGVADAYFTAVRQNELARNPAPPAPSIASALFDMSTHEVGVSLGVARFALSLFPPIPHVGLDYSWAGGPIIGVNTNFLANSIRADFPLWDTASFAFGPTVAAGFNNDTINAVTRWMTVPIHQTRYGSWNDLLIVLDGRIEGPWIQPAVWLAIRSNQAPVDLDLMWGPIVTVGFAAQNPTQVDGKWVTQLLVVATPVVGLTFHPADWLDVTVGGYSLVGARMRFGSKGSAK